MTYGPVLLIMTAITGDDGESPAHAPKESAAHWLEGGAGEMASGSGPQQPRRQERRRISALRERRRACRRMPNRVVPRSSRFVPVTGTGRFFLQSSEPSARSEEGSRDEIPCRVKGRHPLAGFGAAAPTSPIAKRQKSKNRSGAEGDHCDSGQAASGRGEP